MDLDTFEKNFQQVEKKFFDDRTTKFDDMIINYFTFPINELMSVISILLESEDKIGLLCRYDYEFSLSSCVVKYEITDGDKQYGYYIGIDKKDGYCASQHMVTFIWLLTHFNDMESKIEIRNRNECLKYKKFITSLYTDEDARSFSHKSYLVSRCQFEQDEIVRMFIKHLIAYRLRKKLMNVSYKDMLEALDEFLKLFVEQNDKVFIK